MSIGRSHINNRSGRCRTHDREELLQLERLAQARAKREEVRRAIGEDDLRLSGQWPLPEKEYVGPFDTSEFGARAAAPTTDEWVVSQLTMASVEHRLGLRRLSDAPRNIKTWIGVGVAAIVALAATLFFAGSSSTYDVDEAVYPIFAVSVVGVDHPTSTISFRAPAPSAEQRAKRARNIVDDRGRCTHAGAVELQVTTRGVARRDSEDSPGF